jgi:hypothetical protein
MSYMFWNAGHTEEAWISQQKFRPGLVSHDHVYSDGCHRGLGLSSFQTIVAMSFLQQQYVISSLIRLQKLINVLLFEVVRFYLCSVHIQGYS